MLDIPLNYHKSPPYISYVSVYPLKRYKLQQQQQNTIIRRVYSTVHILSCHFA